MGKIRHLLKWFQTTSCLAFHWQEGHLPLDETVRMEFEQRISYSLKHIDQTQSCDWFEKLANQEDLLRNISSSKGHPQFLVDSVWVAVFSWPRATYWPLGTKGEQWIRCHRTNLQVELTLLSGCHNQCSWDTGTDSSDLSDTGISIEWGIMTHMTYGPLIQAMEELMDD